MEARGSDVRNMTPSGSADGSGRVEWLESEWLGSGSENAGPSNLAQRARGTTDEGAEGSLQGRQSRKHLFNKISGQTEGSLGSGQSRKYRSNKISGRKAEGSLGNRQSRERLSRESSEGAEGSLRVRQGRKHSYCNINNSNGEKSPVQPNRSRSTSAENNLYTGHKNTCKGTVCCDHNKHTGLSSSTKRARRSHVRSRFYRDSSSSDEEMNNLRIKRKRVHSRSPIGIRGNNMSNSKANLSTDLNSSREVIDKLLNILKDVKGNSSSKFSMANVIPEFDPMTNDQTILTWLTKVEECAEIYGWDEREIIHFALPKLTGVAKSWYQGLSTVLYSWTEWKKKLIESFPCRLDYAELLSTMLAKRVRFGDSFENYYYDKITLLNRCGISGRKAVDCLLNGIEDRAVRVGAQAAQFQEPEQVLKYLKTVKVGLSREIKDKHKLGRKQLSSSVSNRKQEQTNKIVCHNCNDEGHKSFQCSKQKLKCNFCGKLGHQAVHCWSNKDNNQNKNQKIVKDVAEKQILELNNSDESNKKYILEILVNDIQLMCYVDLGSQCTLLRQREARELGLTIETAQLPIMKGIGGYPITPLGKAVVNITVQGIKEIVEVLVVEDNVLKFPVLLGHSFTECPDITITKTPDKIIFEKFQSNKLLLYVSDDIVIYPQQILLVPINTKCSFTGRIYINGSIRGPLGHEYYIFPGEYIFEAGKGNVLMLNMSSLKIIFKRDSLLSRSISLQDTHTYHALNVSLDSALMDGTLHLGPDVTQEQQSKLEELLLKYKDCFSSNLKDLGLSNVGEMVIELENAEPVVYRPYRLSVSERNLVRNMVDEMLDAGIIKESSSPYASPIVLVKKKTGEKRLCVDYRALNRRTKKEHYPLPRVEDQLDQLSGSKLFISLDLASGYYQIPISESSQDKTAFITPDGQYQYTRMPFGLVNAPSVFQRTINKILSTAKLQFALVYMDDILIPARSFDEGIGRLEQVLDLLRRGGLTLNLSKCNFFFNKIEFLGFEISSEGIKPGARKTDAVSKFPRPRNQHELRQFIGLASFFRRFVREFSVVAKPLTDLLKKNCVWRWSKEHDDAFNALKESLVSRPILALYDPKRETQLHTDASKHGVAGILLQRCDQGLLRPVSYFSRKTTLNEQAFHSYELETLAVVASLHRFRVYLLGIPFKIYTDCNALRTTLTKRDLIPRIARWWIQLQEFDCDIEYRAGSRMSHVDALSRQPIGNAESEDHVLDILTTNVEDWITTVQSNDEEISRMKQILCDPESEKVVEIINNYKLKNGNVYKILGKDNDEIRWVVPRGVRWQVVKMNHDDIGHFGFEKTLTRIQQSFWFPKMRRFVKKYVRSCLECAHHKGQTGKQQGELHPIPKSDIPFHTIHADHLGPFVKSSRGNTYLLVIIDAFTKFVNITPVRNTKTSTTLRVFKEHISYFGTPTRLITDQGTSFTSHQFRSFTHSSGIKHILNAVATPRANGQVERFNRTILDALSTKCHGKDDKSWDTYIPDIQVGLNTTVHKVTGKSPSELLFGFQLKGSSENILSEVIDETITKIPAENLSEIRRDAVSRINDQQIQDKAKFDAKRLKNQIYSVGDLVSVRREVPNDGKSKKLTVKYQGPYRILKVLPNDRYVIEDTPLTKKKGSRRYENIIAVDKMKPWLSFDKNFNSSSDTDNDIDKSQ